MSTKKILIVEDDVASQRLYKHILTENFDVKIDIASSVECAIKYIKDTVYDLYIVDLTLEGNVNGSVLVNTRYRPMIIITVMYIEKELKSMEYLQKPIDVDEFIELVKKLLKI